MTFQNGLNFYSLRVGEQKPFREAMNSLYLTTINSSKKFQKVSPEDEQSILFETSRPNRLFSEPTLTLRDLHMVVPASLLFIYSFSLELQKGLNFDPFPINPEGYSLKVILKAIFGIENFPWHTINYF
jgi:hypothetical protein